MKSEESLNIIAQQQIFHFSLFTFHFFFVPLQPLSSNRDVAQLVAHYVRDVGVGRSSRLIPTTQGCQSQELALQPLKTNWQ